MPVQQETPMPYPFNQAMFDAMMKGFEAAFRNVLTSGQAFPHRTHTPPRKRCQEEQDVREQRLQETNTECNFFLNKVRKLFKAKFDISQDNDFIAYDPADPRDVYAYEFEDGLGPDVDRPSFDLLHGPTSTWNKAVIEILLHEFQAVCQSQGWPFCRSNNYIRVLIIEHYKRLRTVWRKAQPKLTEKGVLETPSEMEDRLIAERNAVLKASRQTTRRRNTCIRRVVVLEHLVELKTEELEDDLDAWVWLKDLVTGLGEHGISSEESGDENDLETVLRVKNLEWRRPMERELSLIDLQRLLDSNVFAPQGSQPLHRIHASGNPVSSRAAVTGLPMAMYNRAWIAGLTQ
ncbi:hypothetical protein JVT61DRAFT_7270 [Boletus reticuloceps]|uniref:Uncharacterized protein n=1 Tax=Boletus reticuloceps TaxID=495285 RepID=A0A8I3A7B4_9AGAM|nr:hypothetical protein JVT61DRAFT_7270 [Boletus reticuloceps]